MTIAPTYNPACNNNGIPYCTAGFKNTNPGTCFSVGNCDGCGGDTALMPHYYPNPGYNGNASSITWVASDDKLGPTIWTFRATPSYQDLFWQGRLDNGLAFEGGQCWFNQNGNQHPCKITNTTGTFPGSANTDCMGWQGGGAFTGITTMFTNNCQEGEWPCNVKSDCFNCYIKQIGVSALDPGTLPDFNWTNQFGCNDATIPGQQYLCANNITPGCSTFDGVGGTDGQRPPKPWDYTPQTPKAGGGSVPDYSYWYDAWTGKGQTDSTNSSQQRVASVGVDFSTPRAMGYGMGAVADMVGDSGLQIPSFGYTPCEYSIDNFDWTQLGAFQSEVNAGHLPGLNRGGSHNEAAYYNSYMAHVCLRPYTATKTVSPAPPCAPNIVAGTAPGGGALIPSTCLVMYQDSLGNADGGAGSACQAWWNETAAQNTLFSDPTYKDDLITYTCSIYNTLAECACYNRDVNPTYIALEANGNLVSGPIACWYFPCKNGVASALLDSAIYGGTTSDNKCSANVGTSCVNCPSNCEQIQKIANNINIAVGDVSQVLNCPISGGGGGGSGGGGGGSGVGSFNIAQYWWIFLVVGALMIIVVIVVVVVQKTKKPVQNIVLQIGGNEKTTPATTTTTTPSSSPAGTKTNENVIKQTTTTTPPPITTTTPSPPQPNDNQNKIHIEVKIKPNTAVIPPASSVPSSVVPVVTTTTNINQQQEQKEVVAPSSPPLNPPIQSTPTQP